MTDYYFKSALRFIDSWLEFQANHQDLTGFAVSIYHDDRIVFSRAYGYANVEFKEKMTTRHLFRVASISKLFTTTAIMQLAEAGKLRLDDAIVRYLPWAAAHPDPRFKTVTVRQVLLHASGLVRDGSNANYWHALAPFPDQRQLRRAFLEAPLYFGDFAGNKYSNMGFALIGEIIEAMAGTTYAGYVQKHIIAPLGLKNTYPDYADQIGQQLATGYRRLIARERKPYPKNIITGSFAASGGMCTTADDLTLFMASRLTGDTRLLSASSIAEMHRPQVPFYRSGQQKGSRGLGCRVYNIGSRTIVNYTGSFPGFHCTTSGDMHDRTIVTALGNSGDIYDAEITEGIYSVLDFFKEHATEPAHPKQAKFAGRFLSDRGADEIVVTNKRIVAIKPSSWLPFSYVEDLAWSDPDTLEIRQSRSSDYAQGEPVRFDFTAAGGPTVTYAGITMWPEKEYLKRLDTTGSCETTPRQIARRGEPAR